MVKIIFKPDFVLNLTLFKPKYQFHAKLSRNEILALIDVI